MAWYDEALVVTGEIIIAAWGNRRRANERYLKGQDGTVTIEDKVVISKSSGSVLDLFELINSSVGVRLKIALNPGGDRRAYFYVDADGSGYAASPELQISKGISPFALGMRVHRHPYNSDRHIESGSASLNAGNTSAITFTDAYASAPNVVFGSAFTNGDGLIHGTSIATTGFTLRNGTAANGTCYWLAEGSD